MYGRGSAARATRRTAVADAGDGEKQRDIGNCGQDDEQSLHAVFLPIRARGSNHSQRPVSIVAAAFCLFDMANVSFTAFAIALFCYFARGTAASGGGRFDGESECQL
jgi:hypothetical protein